MAIPDSLWPTFPVIQRVYSTCNENLPSRRTFTGLGDFLSATRCRFNSSSIASDLIFASRSAIKRASRSEGVSLRGGAIALVNGSASERRRTPGGRICISAAQWRSKVAKWTGGLVEEEFRTTDKDYSDLLTSSCWNGHMTQGPEWCCPTVGHRMFAGWKAGY